MPNLHQVIIRPPLSNALQLANIDISNYNDGVMCEVAGLGLFSYNLGSTATPNNLTVIAPLSLNGRWIAVSGTYLSSSLFSAKTSAPIGNVTGDGTEYKIICDTVSINAGNNYNNTTGIFTAPVSGSYLFTGYISLNGLDANTKEAQGFFSATQGNEFIFSINPEPIRYGLSNAIALGGSIIINMNQADTCSLNVIVDGSTLTVGASAGCEFSGFFIK